jgi:hypothetical protein
MGLPNQFNDIIQRDLNVHAAWLPITQNYELGDYGLIADGVFAKLGNIKEFNISFVSSTGPEAKLDYTSERTRVIKFAGGVEVNEIPAAAIDAKLVFKFENGNSFLIKCPVISVSAISNVQQVAKQLKKAVGWRWNWKVVYDTYAAKDAAVMSTVDGGTDISFSGDAKALKELKIGSASLEFSSNKKLGLDIQGKSGIIALGLFKLKLIGNGPTFLTADEKKSDAEIEILDKTKLPNDL